MKYISKIIAFSLMGYLSMQASFSAETLKVNLSDSIRPVTHCASGSLYGMTETLPANIDEMVKPLKPNMFCLPPEGKEYNQHPFGDGFIVANRLKGTTAKVQITFPDLLPNWPYKWPGQQSWLSSVEKYLKKKVSEGYDNIDSYVIWNEPDGTWNNSNGDLNTTVWKPTYELIRKMDPKTKIVGPCIAYYNNDRMKNFLKFCKENNCLPDLICWHQWGSEGFAGAVDACRKLMKELGISDRPFCINEYCAGSGSDKQKFEGCPGYSVPFIAKFERHNVESATISWWFVPLPGRLGSLLTSNNEKGGGWHLYKWYGDMEGYMARVTPPNDYSDHVDGFAAVDKKHNCASLVLGGNTLGDVNVVFDKIPDFLGGKVKVKVERVRWESKDKAVSGTELVSESEMTINGTSLTVPVKIESILYGYRIYLTPVNVPQKPYNNIVAKIPGKIEIENYDIAGQGFSFYDNDEDNKGGEYRDDAVDIVTAPSGYAIGYTEKGEWLEYTVEVEEDGEYDVTANVSNNGSLDGFQLYVDGKQVTTDYTIPQTGENWSEYDEVIVPGFSMTKGEHVIRLMIVGSYVNIDWLKFELHSSTITNDIYNTSAEGDANYYDLNGHRVNEDRLQNDKIYMAIDPANKIGHKIIKK